MIYQLLLSLISFAGHFIPLEAVKLQEFALHALHASQIGGDKPALKSHIIRRRSIVFDGVDIPVKLAAPTTQASPKMIQSMKAISGSSVAIIGGIAASGKYVGQNTSNNSANDAATENLSNNQPSWWHNLFWGVVYVLLFIAASATGGLIGWELGEMCRKSKLLGWMYVVSEPNSVNSTIQYRQGRYYFG